MHIFTQTDISLEVSLKPTLFSNEEAVNNKSYNVILVTFIKLFDLNYSNGLCFEENYFFNTALLYLRLFALNIY